jgi:glycine/D-amino acid oxidase-like deaminating enzyme
MTREEQLSRLVMAAEPRPFWLDQPGAPPARDPLRGEAAADLVVIGGGFTGLWTALLAKESEPERSVVLVEGHRVGWAASGRNGGFCDASLTHGAANGRERFPAEFAALQRLGAENLDEIQIALDLLSGEPTERTWLRLVRSKPVPFPPEPLAYLGIQITRWSLARADRRGGRRNLWLRALDTAGLGFDS